MSNVVPEPTGEEWHDYRRLILSALTKLDEAQSRMSEQFVKGNQQMTERITDFQRFITEKLNDSQAKQTAQNFEGLKDVGAQFNDLKTQVGDIEVKMAVLKNQMALWGSAAGIVGGAVVTTALHMIFK